MTRTARTPRISRALGALFAVAALLAVGCGSSAPTESTARPDLTSTAQITRTPNAGGELAGCGLEPVYFNFDSADLDDTTRDKLQAAARCVKEQGAQQVRVTGTTDPRGTEEYNLALGDRRATSVKRYLTALGLGDEAVQTHSTGEEFASGSDEGSWASDRRAEFAVE